MSFGTSIRTCLSTYATFAGRARRAEFWWFALLAGIVELVWSGGNTGAGPALVRLGGGLVGLALLLPGLAVLVRRLHDTGHGGGWAWFLLLPFLGTIVLLALAIRDGTRGPNRFGPSPKSPAAVAVPVW